MANVKTQFTKTAIVLEDTKGTYKAPTNNDFAKLSAEGVTLTKTKAEINAEFLDGDSITSDLKLARIGESGFNLSVYLQGANVLGQAPVYSRLFEAYGMSKTVLEKLTTLSGNTASVLKVSETDAAKLSVGQVLKINQNDASDGADKDHISPIKSIELEDDGEGGEDSIYSIELLIPYSKNLNNEVQIETQVEFVESDANPKTVSITNILDGEKQEERLSGGIPSTLSVNNFGQDSLPTLTASGVGFDKKTVLNDTSFEPNFTEGDLLLPEHIFVDGVQFCMSEFSFEMTRNTESNTCIGAKEVEDIDHVGKRVTSGAFTYYRDQEVLPFNLDGKTKRSIFFFQAEYDDVECKKISNFVSFFIPECKFITVDPSAINSKQGIAVGYKATPSNKNKGTRIVIG